MKLSASHRSASAAFEADTEAPASPLLVVSISVCSGDDKHPGDVVEGGAGQPGEPNAF